MKIIIVDDEMSALHTFLSGVIGQTDTEYKFFKDDVNEIMDYVSKNDVTAAFLDIGMPKINGIELARRIIAVSDKIRLVFITGMSITQNNLDDVVRAHTVAILYKPYDSEELKRIISKLGTAIPRMRVQMFGSFDCFYGGDPVRFTSQKSKELFALLLAYNGKTLTMSDAISQLWPDVELNKSKALYRDAVWRLRKTLAEINFNCVQFKRACMFLYKENIDCDFWQYLTDRQGTFPGEFCKNYDWSVDYLARLEDKPQ